MWLDIIVTPDHKCEKMLSVIKACLKNSNSVNFNRLFAHTPFRRVTSFYSIPGLILVSM